MYPLCYLGPNMCAYVVLSNLCARYACPPGERDMFAAKARAQAPGSAGLPVGVQVAALPYQDEVRYAGHQTGTHTVS